MFFTAKIELDPSQQTLIKKVPASGLFSKFLDVLTFGNAGEKVEQESFTAVSVLQDIYSALKKMNIYNIIRLSVDEYDFYYDDKGLDNDIDDAVFQFTTKIDPIESEYFKTLFLVVEHLENDFKYLIEISINKKHKVGEYPIRLNINGVINKFKKQNDENIDELKNRMASTFSSQIDYDNFVNSNQFIFSGFIEELVLNIKSFLALDDIKIDIKPVLIRPKQKKEDISDLNHVYHNQPVYYGYYGFDEYFFYSMLWSGMLYSSGLFINNIMIMDDLGNQINYIGDNGISASDSSFFDDNLPLDSVNNEDIFTESIANTPDSNYDDNYHYSDDSNSDDFSDSSDDFDSGFDDFGSDSFD